MSSLNNQKSIKILIQKMFDYLDSLSYEQLCEEVFAHNLFFEVSPSYIKPKVRTATEVCDIFNNFTKNLDATNRILGELIINIENEKANVFTSSTVTHYKKNTKKGNTREFNGDYHLILTKINNEWRISSFVYSANQVHGNITLE